MMQTGGHDERIKKRFFSTLGIEGVITAARRGSDQSCHQEGGRSATCDGAELFELPLKDNDDDDCTSQSSREGGRIHFDSVVKVVPIPSHSQYSNRIKKVIWSNSAEIKMNARRNLREFAAEGWDWEKVLEEDEMFHDKFSNEFIHPVHLGGIADL